MSPRPALPLRLEYALLGLIRRKPAHGYQLLQQWSIPQGLDIIWHIRPGRLYAALEKLKNLGYFESKLMPGDNSPERRQYSITPSGEQAFMRWMRTPVSAARDFRQEFLAKLYFSHDVDAHVFSELVNLQKLAAQSWLTGHQASLSKQTGFVRLVTSYRLHQVQSMLDWLGDLQA